MDDINNNGMPDMHEAKMARADLYKLANYSMKLFKMIQEGQELEGWVQAKITKAADYIASVYHFMEYEMKTNEFGSHLENAEVYSESVRKAFEQKLMEAKKQQEKISAKAKKEVDEGIEDKLEAARKKAAAKGKKVKDDDKEETKSSTRKVAGKAYGGSKQADEKVDEEVNKSDVPAYKRKASSDKERGEKVAGAVLKKLRTKEGLETLKKKLSESTLVEFAMDAMKHPKYGKIEWINYNGAHMIVSKDAAGVMKIHTMGTQQEIAAKWNKLKSAVAGRVESVVESILGTVI